MPFNLDYLVKSKVYSEHHKSAIQEIGNCLYHYTSPEGFFGIVKSGNLWVTDFRSLNDYEEVTHGFELLKTYLNNEEMQISLCAAVRPHINALQDFFKFWCDQAVVNVENFYIFSLSRKPDQLSQWRAYCPNGGYCIGFPHDIIRDSLNTWQVSEVSGVSKKVNILPCIYDHKMKLKIIGEILNLCVEENPGVNSDTFKIIFYNAFKVFCALFKNKSFYEEAEFRVIAEISGKDNINLEKYLDYRTSRGKIVTYVQIPLILTCLKNGKIPFEVTISKNLFDDKNKKNTFMFLSNHISENVFVKGSSIPYLFK